MIAGVGPALVDHIYSIDRYPPRGGQAIVKKSLKEAGGAAANVIYGLASFGLPCRFYSTIGTDSDADFFISSMKRVGVDVRVSVTHPETGRVDIYVDSEGERTFFVHPNAAGFANVSIPNEDYDEVEYFYLDPFPAKDSFETHLEIARKAKAREKTVILNPGHPYSSMGFEKLSELLKYADIVILSQPEFKSLGIGVREILKYVEILVVTMGAEGSKAYENDEEVYCPAFKVKVVDTTGAGDAFSAGFLYGYVKGYPLKSCLRAGNYVASYSIQHYGARTFPPRMEVEKALSD
ncbi:MAG: carbohydrate kinase family protein [Archaeoglobales archaeon]|nr:MAG: carbohydrate kinase family protein [Archaeoglobales archaeon]